MSLPDEKTLRGYLSFLREILIISRNCAKYQDNHEDIETLLDVVHNLPNFLQDWKSFDEEIFRDQLAFYDKNIPKPLSRKDLKLLVIFDDCCKQQDM